MAAVRKRAVDKAARYLAAATQFGPQASLSEVDKLADDYGLHPRILHHCRLHLEHRREDPLEARWHVLRQTASPAALEQFFQHLFDVSRQPGSEANTASDRPPRPAAFDELLVHARAALADQSGFITVPPQPEYAFDPQTLADYYSLMEQARLLESAAPDEPAALALEALQIAHLEEANVADSSQVLQAKNGLWP